MARNDIKTELYTVDIPNNDKVTDKFPTPNPADSARKALDFFEVDTDKLVPFTKKGDGDFSRWDKDRFQALVQSVKEYGVLEPITVRVLETDQGKYEILAGEHRWLASKELQLKQIPAKLVRSCSDEKAFAIFALTNVMKRESTFRDKVFGCWLYSEKTKNMTSKKIEKMIADGHLDIDKNMKLFSRMHMYRYSRLHSLPEKLFDLIELKVITVVQGVDLANLDPEQLSFCNDNAEFIKNSKQIQGILNLKHTEEGWTEEGVLEILLSTESKKEKVIKKDTLGYARKTAQDIVKECLPKELYSETENILREALSLYKEKYKDISLNI